MSINSEVVLQILRKSPQGFTLFEILDNLMTQPLYQGHSKASLFSELLFELESLFDSQEVFYISHRWVLVEFLDNDLVELSNGERETVAADCNHRARALVSEHNFNDHPEANLPKVVLRILRKSPQGLTKDVILDYILTYPQYQAQERTQVFTGLRILLRSLRDFQIVAYSYGRWSLIESVENAEETFSEVIIQILRRSPQGLTPFEILDNLLTQPLYQGCNRASLFSKLLPELQNLRDSQFVAHVSPRWMLSEFLENKSGEINSQSEYVDNYEKINDDVILKSSNKILYIPAYKSKKIKRLNNQNLVNSEKVQLCLTYLNEDDDLDGYFFNEYLDNSLDENSCEYFLIIENFQQKSLSKEINDLPLTHWRRYVLEERLGWRSGTKNSLRDISNYLNISRNKVADLEREAKTKLDTISRRKPILPKLQKIALSALHCASCINTIEDWCEDIAQVYPPDGFHLPSVLSWLINFMPEIEETLILKKQFFYKAPLTEHILSKIQATIAEFWQEHKISKTAQLHQVILPIIPKDIPNPEKVANTLIHAICHELIPGIFSAEAWEIEDYIYYILYQTEKPLHFSEIGQRIKQLKPNLKAGNIERIVRGLVARHPDIIRCGRGMYGLREWGTMEYGHFREVLLDYLSQQPLPVDAEDIYTDLSQSYIVTRSTVTMTLSYHPNLFKKFGRSSFYGVAGRHYELPDQNLVNLLVSKLENRPVTLSELEQDSDLSKYERKLIHIYLNVSPLFDQIGSSRERKFALSIEGKRQYQPGDAAKIIADIFNQIREPLHVRDFPQLSRKSYAYPPGESTFWNTIAGDEDYIRIVETIFIPRDWMSDETLCPILEKLDTELFPKIVQFTLGSNRRQPSVETLFDWLDFCYKNRFFYRGSLVYDQINLSELSDKKAQIARRIGQVCQRNGNTSVLDLEQDANSEEIDRTLRLDLEDLQQQAQSKQRTPSEGLASIPDGEYRVRYVGVGVEVHFQKCGEINPFAWILKVLVNGEPFDPSRHNPIPSNTASIDQRREALEKLYDAILTAYGQVDPYLQVAIGPRSSWGMSYRQMEPLTEPATGDDDDAEDDDDT